MGERHHTHQVELWAQRIEQTGLTPVAVPLLEIARALGFVAGQLLLLGEPILAGSSARGGLRRAVEWLEEPRRVDLLLTRLLE
jgi:hypothetical protein